MSNPTTQPEQRRLKTRLVLLTAIVSAAGAVAATALLVNISERSE